MHTGRKSDYVYPEYVKNSQISIVRNQTTRLLEWLKLKRTFGEEVERELSYTSSWKVELFHHFGKQFLKQLNIFPLYDLVIPLTCIYQEKWKHMTVPKKVVTVFFPPVQQLNGWKHETCILWNTIQQQKGMNCWHNNNMDPSQNNRSA